MPNRIRRVVGLGWQDEDGDDVTIVRSGEELVVGIVVTPSSDGVRVAVDVGDSIPVRVDVRHKTSTGADLAWSSENAAVHARSPAEVAREAFERWVRAAQAVGIRVGGLPEDVAVQHGQGTEVMSAEEGEDDVEWMDPPLPPPRSRADLPPGGR